MMIFLSFYLPILLSLSLSFLLHAFKKHIHSFFALSTTTTTNYNNLHQKNCLHRPIPSTVTTALVLPPSPPPLIGRMMMATCTESLGFESFDIENDDGDNNIMIYNGEDGGDSWKKRPVAEAAEEEEGFPPLLSSLNGNGQPSFVLLPMRENGRLQLSKVRVKRPETLCATREDGRLRLYLVPDEETEEIVEEDEVTEEIVEEEEETEEVEEESVVEEEVVEMISRYFEEEEEEEDRVREWEFPARFRRCHQEVHHHIQCHQHVHSSHHHNLNLYGVGIA